jgi:hypothetical protein
MTKQRPRATCSWCRRPIESVNRGRPRLYCGHSHRQRAYEARRAGTRLALLPGRALVRVEALERLSDLLYTLEAAVEDVERDALEGSEARVAALEGLLRAAEDLRGLRIEPEAVAE